MEPILTIKIEAPEIVNAINNLFGALLKPEAREIKMPEITSISTPIPTTNQPMTQAPQPVNYSATSETTLPTVERTYTLDELSYAATPLISLGKQQGLITLLAEFGVQALTQLSKEQYGAFATKLRALGAKI